MRFCKIELHRERFAEKYGANFKGGQEPFRPFHRGGWGAFPFFPSCLPFVALRFIFCPSSRGAFLAVFRGGIFREWAFLAVLRAFLALGGAGYRLSR